jgi:O-acetylserine/cysteine efflux transporter
MPPRHLLLLIIVNLVWGLNLIAGKIGVDHIPPIMLAGLRFALLMIVLAPFLRWQKGQMPLLIAICITMGALHFALIWGGLASADNVAGMAVAIQLAVPFATILSIVLLGESVAWRRWIGMLLAFAGVVVIAFDPAIIGQPLGLLLVTAGAFVGALGVIGMKRLHGIGVMAMQAWLALISTPILLAVSWLTEHGQLDAVRAAPPIVWGALLFSSLGASLFGHGSMYYLIQRYDVSLLAPFNLLATIFAVIAAVVFLGEPLTLRIVAGGSITLLGVYIIAKRQAVRPPGAPVSLAAAAPTVGADIGTLSGDSRPRQG